MIVKWNLFIKHGVKMCNHAGVLLYRMIENIQSDNLVDTLYISQNKYKMLRYTTNNTSTCFMPNA